MRAEHFIKSLEYCLDDFRKLCENRGEIVTWNGRNGINAHIECSNDYEVAHVVFTARVLTQFARDEITIEQRIEVSEFGVTAYEADELFNDK